MLLNDKYKIKFRINEKGQARSEISSFKKNMFWTFYIGLNATCMVQFITDLSKVNLSGESPSMALLLAVYPVTCCIPTQTLASVFVCGDGCQGKSLTPLHPTAQASLESKMSE